MSTNPKKSYNEINKCICFIWMTSHDEIVVEAHGEINDIFKFVRLFEFGKRMDQNFVKFVDSDARDARPHCPISSFNFSWWVGLGSKNIESFQFESVQLNNNTEYIVIFQKYATFFKFTRTNKYTKRMLKISNEFQKQINSTYEYEEETKFLACTCLSVISSLLDTYRRS